LLIVALVPVLIKEWPAISSLIGHFSLVVMIVFAVIGLTVGHWLGPGPRRSQVLALATSARPLPWRLRSRKRRRSAGRDGGRAAGAGGQFDRFHSLRQNGAGVHQAPPPDGHSQVM
jgi:hypothetical protein